MPQLSHLKTRDGIWLGFGPGRFFIVAGGVIDNEVKTTTVC